MGAIASSPVSCGDDPTSSAPLPDDLPASVATIDTSLDFGDPPLRGELRIVSGQPGLEYAVDLDGDGNPEESGPLGLGVTVGYEFVVPGSHTVAVILTDGSAQLRVATMIVVNDPETLERDRQRTRVVEGPFGGIAIDGNRVTAYASAPTEDLLLRFDPGDLTESWRLPLTIQDLPLWAGGVAIDPSGTTVFVDVGDSLVRIDVSGSEPRPPEPFARAHRGSIVEVLPNGNLVAGGHGGLLLIDSASGEILNEFEPSIYDLEVSPNGQFIAVSGTFGLALLSAEDLSEVWGTFRGDAQGYSALSFSPSGDVFLALVRTSEEWVLSVIQVESGATRRRYLLGPAELQQSTEFMTQLTTRSADGRFAVFATGAGAFVADASTGMPIAREVEGFLDPLPLGCCSVVWTDAGPLFASGGGPFGEGALIKLRIAP
jgi:hypothetical protein